MNSQQQPLSMYLLSTVLLSSSWKDATSFSLAFSGQRMMTSTTTSTRPLHPAATSTSRTTRLFAGFEPQMFYTQNYLNSISDGSLESTPQLLSKLTEFSTSTVATAATATATAEPYIPQLLSQSQPANAIVEELARNDVSVTSTVASVAPATNEVVATAEAISSAAANANEVADAATVTATATATSSTTTPLNDMANEVATQVMSNIDNTNVNVDFDAVPQFVMDAVPTPSLVDSMDLSSVADLSSTISSSGSDSINEAIGSLNSMASLINDNALTAAATSATSTGNNINNGWGDLLGGTDFSKISSVLMSATDDTLSLVSQLVNKAGAPVAKTVSSSLSEIPTKSLAQLAGDVAGGIRTMSGSVFKVFNDVDTILTQDAHINLGCTASNLLEGARISLSMFLDDAVQSVVNSIQAIEGMTVIEFIQSLFTILTVVAKIIYIFTNALIQLVSGQTVNAIALAMANALQVQATVLSDQALASLNDLTHTSLIELSNYVTQFSNQVADGVITLASTAIHVVG